MAESALRQLVPQSAEPFVRSYNPFNPAFRETMRASISDLLGGRAIGGTPSQRYRANIADMLTGAVEMAPGVGEAVGVTDTRQAIRSGDYGTAAILGGATALGMVPVIGDAASRAVREGLDMSTAARMQRAQEQSYLPETVYHGTAQDISEFNPQKFGGSVTKASSAKMGTWLSDNPDVSATYARYAAEDLPVSKILEQADRAGRARNFDEQERLYALAEEIELSGQLRNAGGQNIIPARIKGNMFEVDAEGATMSDLDESQLYQWAQEAKNKGYDGLKIKNFSDNADYGQYLPATHYLVFNPANIRSVNAAFDPTKSSSANLMAGVGGTAVGLSALNQLVPRNEERQPD